MSGNRPGETKRLQGNEVFPLDDPRVFWRIESGHVAVFSVPKEPGGTGEGARRFFFRSGPGELLFGFPDADNEERPRVVAVALEETTLRSETAEAPPTDLARAWLDRWAACVDPPGDGASPDLNGRNADDPRRISDALREFHESLLDRLHALAIRERAEESDRLAERERRFGEEVHRAIERLTSVFRPRTEAPRGGGSDLFAAASAVGHAAGMVMKRPPSWAVAEGSVPPVESIAAASHVRARRVTLHPTWWTEDCGAVLGFDGPERRPVALLPRTGGRGYDRLDPGNGTRERVDAAVARTLEGQGWVFYRPLPENATKGIELIRFALHGRARDLRLVLLAAVAATLLGMFTPQAVSLLVDHALPDSDRSLLMQIGGGLLAAALGMAVFRWSQGIAMIRIETSADGATQAAVWDRLLKLKLSFFREYSTGDLLSRVTAISQIRSLLGGTTLRTLFGGLVLLLNFALLLYYSPVLTLLAVAVAVVSGALTIVSGTMIIRCARKVMETSGRFFGFMVQLVNGIAKLRVAAAEERAFGRWATDYARLLDLELAQRRIQDSVAAANLLVSSVSLIALFLMASALVGWEGGGGITAGEFLAFHVAYGTFIGAIVSLSNSVTDVLSIAVLRERARPILEAAPEVTDRRADPGRLAGRVELKNVVFKYREDGPMILREVNFRAEPGEFVALVGPSGSGKSTLFRLLLGFDTPLSGSVFFDGQDLSGLDVQAVRRQLGVVLQNGRINAGSVFENIATGTNVTLTSAWEAARAAGFAEDVEAMPMGMHTMVSEGGTNLSGGQRQRLLVTRALVHAPRVLLLDEATSALDNRTQAVVSESLDRLQVTRIVIAHRLSTIRNADRIYVLDGGQVVQEGTFAELAREEGLFSRLIARQVTE